METTVRKAAYVENFKIAYDEMVNLYQKKEALAFHENGMNTLVFDNYYMAVRDTVHYQLLSNKNGNYTLAKILRDTGDYALEKISYDGGTVFQADELLEEITSKILKQDKEKQYYLGFNDAAHAFRCMSMKITSLLKDDCRKLQRRKKVDVVPLEAPVFGKDGKSTPLIDFIVDENACTEDDASDSLLSQYVKDVLVPEICTMFLKEKTPHYMLAFLYSFSGKSMGDLDNDLKHYSWDYALDTILDELYRNQGINLEFVGNEPIQWKIPENAIKANATYNWKSQCIKKISKHYANMTELK